MKITGQASIDAQFEAKILRKQKNIMKKEGEQVLKLIDKAGESAHLENRPLASGSVGTKINIAA